jgi:hypothetical protein
VQVQLCNCASVLITPGTKGGNIPGPNPVVRLNQRQWQTNPPYGTNTTEELHEQSLLACCKVLTHEEASKI